MTGYGSCEKDGIRVEIRSLNHRFLEINFKTPQTLFRHEAHLRKMIKETTARGRLDVFISMPGDEKSYRVTVNDGFVGGVVAALRKMKEDYGLDGGIDTASILLFKEAVTAEPDEVEASALYDVFRKALEDLKDMRLREGEALAADVLGRIRTMESMLEVLRAGVDASAMRVTQRLKERIMAAAAEFAADEGRLIQEAAALAEKADVSEELQRIGNHLKQFGKILADNDSIDDGPGVPVGRKLDFILQELAREANTMSAKAAEYGINALVVDFKSELEKVREQIQNIQ
jgi:uncharacterized protein (TIGR00255 family)